MIYKNEEITKIKPKLTFSKLFVRLIILVIIAAIAVFLYSTFLVLSSLASEEKDYMWDMKAYMIETSSMEPELVPGDVVIVRKVENLDDIKKDEIITFKNRGEVITHRVSSINSVTKKITTKGDKNASDDIEPINIGDVLGKKVFKISRFDIIEKAVRNIFYWMVLILIFITLFLKSRRISRKKMMRRRKKKNEDQNR